MSAREDRTCSCCGGEIPAEGTAAWLAGRSDCPGHVTTASGRWSGALGCGAFGPIDEWGGDEDDQCEVRS